MPSNTRQISATDSALDIELKNVVHKWMVHTLENLEKDKRIVSVDNAEWEMWLKEFGEFLVCNNELWHFPYANYTIRRC